jgi:thioredoxin-like negative regulator of GroEL
VEEDTSAYIKDFTSMADWNAILDSPTPVVFQCSTSWCRPCQVLKPLMQKAVSNLGGKVIFYYIDIEKHGEIGEMLQVSGVPHVFAVKNGEISDEFSGVVGNDKITEFLNKAAEK